MIFSKVLSTQPGWILFDWNGSLQSALTDLARMGYQGVELLYDSSTFEPYREKPEPLRDKLIDAGIKSVGITVSVDLYISETIESDLARCTRVADTVATIGGEMLLVVPGVRRFKRPQHELTDRQYQCMADALNEIGRVCCGNGIRFCLNPHVRRVIERRHEVSRILGLTDPALVGLSFDPSHTYIGGWDPVECVEQHGTRISCVHLRNLRDGHYSNPAVGEINMIQVLTSLKKIGYRGWMLPCIPAYAHYGKSEAEVANDNFAYLRSNLW